MSGMKRKPCLIKQRQFGQMMTMKILTQQVLWSECYPEELSFQMCALSLV